VPGVPNPLAGVALSAGDDGTLLVAGHAETDQGAIYSIAVRRGACGHIVGFDGEAKEVSSAPFVDANLVYAPGNVLFYSGWPEFELGEVLPNASSPAQVVNLKALGMSGGGPGGIGFVPPDFPGAGGLRASTWPDGLWYHLSFSKVGPVYSIDAVKLSVALDNGGGFAYVPNGSARFAKPSVVVSEWSTGSVGAYEVDGEGDPIPTSRRDFFTAAPGAWGSYFDDVTGDFIVMSFGAMPDHAVIVQGFAKPAAR
jgi:hypothetical protein